MYEYAMALQPIVIAGGIDGLDAQRKEVFKGLLEFMATMIRQAKEVESVIINEDFTLIVTAKEDIEATLKKIGSNAIISRL